jgi:hypothetical protein
MTARADTRARAAISDIRLRGEGAAACAKLTLRPLAQNRPARQSCDPRAGYFAARFPKPSEAARRDSPRPFLPARRPDLGRGARGPSAIARRTVVSPAAHAVSAIKLAYAEVLARACPCRCQANPSQAADDRANAAPSREIHSRLGALRAYAGS